MKKLSILYIVAALLLAMSFQVQAQADPTFTITDSTSLGNIISEFGEGNVDVEDNGGSKKTVTITSANGEVTVVYLYRGKAIGVRINSILTAFSLAKMTTAFPAVVQQYAGTTIEEEEVVIGGGDGSGGSGGGSSSGGGTKLPDKKKTNSPS